MGSLQMSLTVPENLSDTISSGSSCQRTCFVVGAVAERPWPWRQEPRWKSSGRRSLVVATSAITFSGAVCSSHLEISLVVCSGRQAAEFGRALAESDATRARELAALEVDVARFQSPAASAHCEIVGRHKLVESSR